MCGKCVIVTSKIWKVFWTFILTKTNSAKQNQCSATEKSKVRNPAQLQKTTNGTISGKKLRPGRHTKILKKVPKKSEFKAPETQLESWGATTEP